MSPTPSPHSDTSLAACIQRARRLYAACLGGHGPWWDVVVITASSKRQAGRYEEELSLRRARSQLPPSCRFLVAADLDDERIGSGGATLNALRAIGERATANSGSGGLREWWSSHRALIIHSGGDSRRMPQWSSTGKLFSPLPVSSVSGDPSTVFDELLTLSTLWAERASAGLVITSGDVVLVFDPEALRWDRPGVCGVAMAEPLEVAARHGVYVADERGRVYTFLQKPSAAQVRAAGGEIEGGRAAVDIGILKLEGDLAARLTELSGVRLEGGAWRVDEGILAPVEGVRPALDLYHHFTTGLTGSWRPGPEAPEAHRRLEETLRGIPFFCDRVEGVFQHVGTTALFREVMTSDESLSGLYEAHQRIGRWGPEGVGGSAVVIDSVFESAVRLEPGAIALECHLAVPVTAGRGAILHGLQGLSEPVEVPAGVVAHQVPIAREDGLRGCAVALYSVEDDPKASGPDLRWLDQPAAEALARLGFIPEDLWAGVPEVEQTLWNARLFPVADGDTAWWAAQWLMGEGGGYDLEQWRAATRVSLADAARWADPQAATAARLARAHAQWRLAAVETARSGGAIAPMLRQGPGARVLRETAESLRGHAAGCREERPTAAASLRFQASEAYAQAGLAAEAEEERTQAFEAVREAVTAATSGAGAIGWSPENAEDEVVVTAPVRVDLVGGWSDTPPFCLEWGGAVLNAAIDLDGRPPVRCVARRLPERCVRLISEDTDEVLELSESDALQQAPPLGSPFAIPLAALRMAGFGDDLAEVLGRLGWGIELRSRAAVPVGSGLGTSSIVAAAVTRGLLGLLGAPVSAQRLSDLVLALEQSIGAGGGWQDQAGAIFPGLKLLHTSPGLRQWVQARQVHWTEGARAAFERRMVLYYTGIRRIARNILGEVVGRTLAREPETMRVLHDIRHAAVGAALAFEAGDFEEAGRLLDLQWHAKVSLDPNATNGPINTLLGIVRPYVHGASVAGAGGGGFVIALARDEECADRLRERLGSLDGPGRLQAWSLNDAGLEVSSTAVR